LLKAVRVAEPCKCGPGRLQSPQPQNPAGHHPGWGNSVITSTCTAITETPVKLSGESLPGKAGKVSLRGIIPLLF